MEEENILMEKDTADEEEQPFRWIYLPLISLGSQILRNFPKRVQLKGEYTLNTGRAD